MPATGTSQDSVPTFSLGNLVWFDRGLDRLWPLHYSLDAGDWRQCGAFLPCFLGLLLVVKSFPDIEELKVKNLAAST